MNKDFLSTDSYKGVRDFYPEDMAIQRYMFDVWGQTAESFGYERYDASILEPATLYKAKGAENVEMVNEQTYTFTDRGNREVTLRPEMTPSVARMIAKRSRELAFPVRWYSIPSLYRYERAQRGRLREHWQLNCDLFGSDDYTADVELIALGYQIFMNFGADESMFEILINDRQEMTALYESLGVTNEETQTKITRLNDHFDKITEEDYRKQLAGILGSTEKVVPILKAITNPSESDNKVKNGLAALGITNVRLDRTLARGFDYYTGTIFEFKDTDEANNRSLLGGGRYDNLAGLFGEEKIAGIGFGFGDVTMRHFLETHDLMTAGITAPDVMVIPTESEYNLHAHTLAQDLRKAGASVGVDISTKKVGKKLDAATKNYVTHVVVVGEDEVKTKTYELKNLATNEKTTGSAAELAAVLE